jgi:hypothetical protein
MMAKKPELLKQAIGALKAMHRINVKTHYADDDKEMRTAFKRVERVLTKAKQAA